MRVVPKRHAQRARFVDLLRARAEQMSRREHPYRRVSWTEIEEALRTRTAMDEQFACSRTRGALPAWALDLVLACCYRGFEQGQRFGEDRIGRRSRALVARVLRIGRAIRDWHGGLRLEEISAITGMDENVVHRTLAWAKGRGALVDHGERGWFLAPPAGA